MQRLRGVIKEHNIYRWARDLIADLSEIRLDTPEAVVAPSRSAGASW